MRFYSILPVIQRIFSSPCKMDTLIKFVQSHLYGSLLLAVVVALATYLHYRYSRHLQHWAFDVTRWSSYEIDPATRCNKMVKEGKFVQDHRLPGKRPVKTMYDCLMHGCVLSKDGPCFGYLVNNFTKYEWYTFSQVIKQAGLIGKMLRSKGIRRQQCVGIYAVNSCEWLMTEFACVLQSFITVPLYDTLGLESICHSINEVEMPVLFSDSLDKLKQTLAIRDRFPALKMFVLLHDNVSDQTFCEQCQSKGIEFLTWTQAKSLGAKHPEIEHDRPTPNDIFTIQYTSGTTGLSKGVIITHRNIVACVAGSAPSVSSVGVHGDHSMTKNDTCFLYLPLAHVYAQCCVMWTMLYGGRTGISSGKISRLIQDAQLLQPTYFPLVPRVMNRLYTKVLDETMHGFKGWLFWKCYALKKMLYKQGIWTNSSIYDWIVFGKLQKMIGGKVRLMTSASAPIAPEVLEFWRIVFGTLVVEAYGQTETSGVVTCAIDFEGNNVGHVSNSCLVRLLDIPEMGYSTKNNPPRGEICVKGANVMPGYYKRPQQTKEAFTPDGWLMTGDIGEFLPNGSLRIIDRKKHIFKLSQGEYVAPEKIESIYVQCPLVAQVFADGDSLQTFVVAVVVPDEKEAKDWAVEHSLENATLAELCANRDFQRHVLNEMTVLGHEKHLLSFEQAKSVFLTPDSFTIENGLLTPSLKNKRADLRRRFHSEVEALYKAGPIVASSSRE